jgi:hypothetical protein
VPSLPTDTQRRDAVWLAADRRDGGWRRWSNGYIFCREPVGEQQVGSAIESPPIGWSHLGRLFCQTETDLHFDKSWLA